MSTTEPATDLQTCADDLADIAGKLGLTRLAETILAETTRRLDRAQLRVLVLGEIKQGKSTLINALLGQPLLPSGVTPTTGAVVQIVRGDELGRFLVGPGGERSPLDTDRFLKLARGKEEFAGTLIAVTPSEHLPFGVELIDTPGINDLQKVRSMISRGELPRGDALVLVLDATQVLKLTEVAFLRDALLAVGGTENTGATLLLVVNRIDLIPEAERPALLDHIHRELTAVLPGPVELFQTDARGAGKQPDSPSLGVREVLRLRERLAALASQSTTVLPTRTRSSLERYAELLSHHAAVEARALRLEAAALQTELTAVRQALVEQRLDLDAIDATLAAGRERIVADSRTRLLAFRDELQASIFAQLDRNDLRNTADLLPGAIQDAALHFTYQEVERLRLQLEQLTRDAIKTCGEQAQRRLAETLLNLGFRGPAVHLKPTSVAMEAGSLAVGVIGTAIMYFGNVVAGLVVTVAAPLATMFLRERSIRELREDARQSVPLALARSFSQLEAALARSVDAHVAGLKEYLVLAHSNLGAQLQTLLERALALAEPTPAALGSAPSPEPPAPAPSPQYAPPAGATRPAKPAAPPPVRAPTPTAAPPAAPVPENLSPQPASDPRRTAALADLRKLEQHLEQIRTRLAQIPA
ncbi:MAG: dynamin family protein [Myxococcales bacterium]|nr:dynamin family protein [Myxococcales bacterium]